MADPDVVQLVLHLYGADWAIQHDAETGIWTAVQYPTPTATRVLVGRDVEELRDKLAELDAATGGGGGEPRPTLKG